MPIAPDNYADGYEAGLNPKKLSINYRKNSGLIPNSPVKIMWEKSIKPGTIQIIEKPAWLKVISEDVFYGQNSGDILRSDYKVAIDAATANNLSVGLYSGQVRFKGEPRSISYTGWTYTLQVDLTVLEDVKLSIDKSNFFFSYTIGNVPPLGQFLGINTDRAWTIAANQSWLNFSQDNGNGNATISLSPDVANLDAGLYYATFIVDDGANERVGYVTLSVVGGTGNEEDYLNVNPTVLDISENYQEPSASSKVVRIDSSLPVVVTSNVAWLDLSAANLPAGLNNLTVSTVNTDVLEVGVYPAQISIKSNFGEQVVNVILRIVANVTSGIVSNGFYFAADRNTLFLTNASQNAEAVLDFVTRGTLEVKFYKRRVPFFRNSASIIIGQETQLLLKPQSLPANLLTQMHTPLMPIRYDFTVYDKALNTAAMVERKKLQNIFFVNGKTPKIQNRLTYLPSQVTVPRDGVIAFSFISEAPVGEITITGAVNATYQVSTNGDRVYTAIVNLQDLEVYAGNKITIAAGPVSVDVRIKGGELPTSQLIWLNEWDCPEIINLDGEYKEFGEDDSTVVVTNRDGREYSRVLETKEPKSFRVNTGNIFSEAEVEFLASILKSKRIWLQYKGKRNEVIRNFRSISISETRRFNTDFDLTFDSAVK